MQSSTNGDNTPTATHTYSPSVPLSLYRELAVELQAAEAKLDCLSAQNQQLAKQNQQLRQEIETAVQSVLRLQQVVDAAGAVSGTYTENATPDFRTQPSRPVSEPRQIHRSSRPASAVQSVVEGQFPFQKGESTGLVYSEKLFTEQEEVRNRHRSHPESPSPISAWWLAIAILLIIVTAFGAGYLIVSPLLKSR